MDFGTFALVAGALLGTGGLAALLQAGAVSRRTAAEAHKVDADAEVTLGGGWKVLVAELRGELNEMRERLSAVEQREAECKARLAKLEAAGGTPEHVERTVARLVKEEIARREHR